MQNLNSTEFLAELFLCPVPSGPPSIENAAHDTEKLLLKTQVSSDFA